MKRKTGIKSIMTSVQLKFALVFLVLIAALLAMLNIYPTIITRDMMFSSKQSSLQAQAGVMSSALSAADKLSTEYVSEAVSLLDLRSMTRVLVTDENSFVLYDTAELDPARGRYALFYEIYEALEGNVVCRCNYDGKAFITVLSTPITSSGITKGAVYLYEYDEAPAQLISEIQITLRNITFFLGAVAIILLLFFSRALTSRITELVKATRIVSAGDYDHQITVRGSDELSELGEEFNILTLRLKETEELRRRFVSDASHELKTPLASIRLLSDSIVNAENMPPDTMLEFVTDIGAEAERLQRTTEKLLSLSKMDAGAGLDFRALDLRESVENTLHLLEPLAQENKIAISTDLQDGCTIYGNEDLIYRVIFNLSENGIKYNVPEGIVHIRLFRENENIILIVEDTGIGIPETDLPHIFSRFYRVDKARSRDAGGSGLGLSIVYDAVHLHGGDVTVERRTEYGTRFTVTFPAYVRGEDTE